ncbi:MAG: TonB-dependent receptor [Flavobacteriales bacterium]
MKTFVLTAFAIAIFAKSISAQVLTGKVTDTQNVPIEDVYIFHTNSEKHTHTNHTGLFQMEQMKKGDTLVVNHIGFEEVRVAVENFEKPLLIVLNEKTIAIDEVLITESIDALNLITRIDLQTSPVNNSQEILRKVPGLFIGQHAGGGKAEQIFLRGFDIDHGTDINLTVDGMPVNMVSHAHGQGYADLHFVIPETVDKIDFGKGPYAPDQGNFATAGYVAFKTKDRLSESLIKLGAGQFNSTRMLGMFNVLSNENQSAYIAADFISNDGPFESPQNFKRNNLMVKYSVLMPGNGKVSVLLSHFNSSWDASGQVPQRAVDAGLITRFGAIDDREGGNTSRTNFAVDYSKNINDYTVIKNTIYFSLYDFELYSNFTFFLEDSINGDQIKQKEHRQMFGVKSELKNFFTLVGKKGSIEFAVGLRSDQTTDSELSHTAQRKILLDNMQLGDISETNYYSYANAEFHLGKWLINPAMRVDYFENNYNNQLDSAYKTQSAAAAIVSPKLNILYNYSNQLQVYLKTGRGIHSNDTRVVVPKGGREILPAATGADLGFIWKPVKNMIVNAAAWYLFLEQEFVYVGDAGVVEPSGRTQRQGVDLGVRYQLTDWLFLNADANQCIARSMDNEEGNNLIPLVPDFTATCGISVLHSKGFYGGVSTRYMKDRPANEDNSIVANGYTIVDANAGYRFKHVDLALSIENVLNTEWNETQFATESRLQGEQQSVEEIHFTPGIPFFMKGSLGYRF